MYHVAALLLFVVGGSLGLKFADCDQSLVLPPVLVHRSLLTHGLLAPLLLYLGFYRRGDLWARWFVMGFCLASAVHLCFDLFPRRWFGFANVYVPFYGRTGAVFSCVWLAVGAFTCLVLACRLIEKMRDFVVAVGGLSVSYGVSAVAEPRIWLPALLVLVAVAFMAFVLPRPGRDKDKPPSDPWGFHPRE